MRLLVFILTVCFVGFAVAASQTVGLEISRCQNAVASLLNEDGEDLAPKIILAVQECSFRSSTDAKD